MPRHLSKAHLTAAALLPTAALLAIAGAPPQWVCLPLLAFLAMVALAPAFSRWGFFLPVLSRGEGSQPQVAITFDDGPDSRTLPALLSLLERHGAKATFFVVGERVKERPELVHEILGHGHEVGNHSLTHDPLLMFRSMKRLHHEVQGCQDVLAPLGIRPTVFRPPAGVTNSRLPIVLEALGLTCVTFNVRPLDFGNRRLAQLAQRVLGDVGPGAIVLLHDTLPHAGTLQGWLDEVDAILTGLRMRGLEVVPLSVLLGRPIMLPATSPAASVPSIPTSKSKWLAPVAQAMGIVAYPAAMLWGVDALGVRTTVLLLLTWHLPGAVKTFRRSGRRALGLASLAAVVVSLWVLAAVLEDSRYMLAYPTLINVAFLAQFGWSLVRGPPLIERFARLQEPHLSEEKRRYCRTVTRGWCGFFALNGTALSALAMFAPRSWWVIHANGVSYLLMGFFFAIEFTVRRIRFGGWGHGLADLALRRILPRSLLDRNAP